MTPRLRPVDWVPGEPGRAGRLRVLDQTLLPAQARYVELDDVEQVCQAIARLAVRGAPALGVVGAFGVAIAAERLPADAVPTAAAKLRAVRPTAVNLARGVDLALAALPRGPDAVVRAAVALRDAEITASTGMARLGSQQLYAQATPGPSGYRVLTVCNTGALAAVERGTALAAVEQVWLDGRLDRVVACETRPLLQGARLTAWELQHLGIPFDLVVDAAACWVMAGGTVDAVLVGADRIAANGDAANKIGTFPLALGAREAGIPFYVVAPESTVDRETPTGGDIVVEDRGSTEVVTLAGHPLAPAGTTARNPAFDVTPAHLITAIVTDTRVIDTAHGQRPDD